MILKGHPKTEWPELRLKTVAQDLLKGQRSEWGYKRKWEGNYLSLVSCYKYIIFKLYT